MLYIQYDTMMTIEPHFEFVSCMRVSYDHLQQENTKIALTTNNRSIIL